MTIYDYTSKRSERSEGIVNIILLKAKEVYYCKLLFTLNVNFFLLKDKQSLRKLLFT